MLVKLPEEEVIKEDKSSESIGDLIEIKDSSNETH